MFSLSYLPLYLKGLEERTANPTAGSSNLPRDTLSTFRGTGRAAYRSGFKNRRRYSYYQPGVRISCSSSNYYASTQLNNFIKPIAERT